MGRRFNFFREVIKNYKTSGTIVPSSRFLARRMLKPIDFSNAEVIVELGPGNGAITKHILKRMYSKTTLVCFEINPVFYDELLKINHPQLIVLQKSAENIRAELKKLGFDSADYILSSLPLSILPKEIPNNILEESKKSLQNGGMFIQYQYTLIYYGIVKKIFNNNLALEVEFLNFPPAFVYICKKNSTLAAEKSSCLSETPLNT